MSFTSPVRSTLSFKYSLLFRIMMSSNNKLAKQRMLSSTELCPNDLAKLSNELILLQMLTEKNGNSVRKIKHSDLETTGYKHACTTA